MSPLGTVSQLGEVNVRPLSVPASYNSPGTLKLSIQPLSSLQRETLEIPVNQSGEGISRVIKDTWKS